MKMEVRNEGSVIEKAKNIVIRSVYYLLNR
jgi:hypothetical protein